MKKKATYGLAKSNALKKIAAPRLDYLPPMPKRYRPRIGLIGCGGITQQHLSAYRKAGWNVVAMADIKLEHAEKRRDEFIRRRSFMPITGKC